MKKGTYVKSCVAAGLLLLTAVWLASCGGGGSKNAASPTQVDRSNFNELGTYPLVKNKENITILAPTTGLQVDYGEFWQSGYYENMTNVHVNWQYAPSEQFKERVNLVLASAEKLDLILGFPWGDTGFSQTEFLKLANQRLILPIGDYFDTDTIHTRQNLDTVEYFREVLTMPDGKIYNLPNFIECLHCAYYGKMWINKEFLKNVGITKYPETAAEFRTMLIAFRDKDANGNGDPKDEIPMMGTVTPGVFSSRLDTYFMSAFGVYSDGLNRLYMTPDKKVNAAYQQPGFREGLKYLSGLYKEGLISRDSFSTTIPIRHQTNSQKYESVIGAIPYEHMFSLGVREEGQPVRWIDYEAIPPLKAADGKRIARYDPYNKFQLFAIGGMVPATCRNPALIARWLDYYQTYEGALLMNFGGKGIGWDDPDPNGIGAGGVKAAYKKYELKQDHEWYSKNTYGGFIPVFQRTTFWAEQQSPAPLTSDGTGAEAYLYQITENNYQPYGDGSLVVPPLWYSAEDASEMGILATNINTYVEESIAKFVVGDLDPNKDADWNAFQTQLGSLNVGRYLEIIQKTYDASAFAK